MDEEEVILEECLLCDVYVGDIEVGELGKKDFLF